MGQDQERGVNRSKLDFDDNIAVISYSVSHGSSILTRKEKNFPKIEKLEMAWNHLFTILASLACTAASGAVIISITNYLMRDHHRTVKANSFKLEAKGIKKELSNIKLDFGRFVKKILTANQPNKVTDSEDSVETSSVNSGASTIRSKVVLNGKSHLEVEETLLRFLVRCDSIQVRKLSEAVIASDIDQGRKDLLICICDNLLTERKATIEEIQAFNK